MTTHKKIPKFSLVHVKYTLIYIVLIPLINWSFTWAPMIQLPWVPEWAFNPVTVVTGLVLVARDFSQREIGHEVLIAMGLALFLTFVTSGGALALASGAAFLISELRKLNSSLTDKVVFSAIKGIVPESGLIVGEHFFKNYNIPYKNIGVITGPCHAEEVAMERLSYLTIACQDQDQAKKVGECLKSRYLRVKISDDIIGTEYAAMLKNIFSIAAGISHGLGYGDNFQSVLMSNSIREMDRFIKKIHQMKRNINNSAYLGDLLVTGYSTFSRNRMFGNMIGKGYTVKSAMLEMSMVAEGYYATKSAKKIKEENGAITPIIDAVYSVLYKGKDAKRVFEELTKQID